jgi:putative component of membrane protein insertase Oxa1/YidC/SpoIIIJ protein YidD
MTPLARFGVYLLEKYQNRGGGEELFNVDCNFIPSCSEYTKLCIQKFGFFVGTYLGIKRILRCKERDLVEKRRDPPPSNWRIAIMLNNEEVEVEEDRLREEINKLPDDYRKEYYKTVKKQIKDPDTYAVLNYSLFVGLHHFYLGRWFRALTDIFCLLLGIVLLFNETSLVSGVLIIGIITAVELYELFRSQLIVQHNNNLIMQKILKDLNSRRSGDIVHN